MGREMAAASVPRTMKTLVTGGAGFIGSHVSRELLNAGHSVVVLDDLSGGRSGNIPPAAMFVQASVTDHALVESLFVEHGFDYVFHIAAYAAEGLSHHIRRFNYNNNVIGSVNLINAAVNTDVKCFVFTSSIAVYGSGEMPFNEKDHAIPEDPYGVAKLAVEQDLRIAQRTFGLRYVILRPHNVYGERQNIVDRYRNVVGIFMRQVLRGEPMAIFGDGEQTRAFSYIGDVAPLIARAIDTPAAYNQIINLGSDQVCSINELAEAVARVVGVEKLVVHLEARCEVRHAQACHDRMRTIFGTEAETLLQDGLSSMAPWARSVNGRLAPHFADIEIDKNIPGSWVSQE